MFELREQQRPYQIGINHYIDTRGRKYDLETGNLIDGRGRHHDPLTGRFTRMPQRLAAVNPNIQGLMNYTSDRVLAPILQWRAPSRPTEEGVAKRESGPTVEAKVIEPESPKGSSRWGWGGLKNAFSKIKDVASSAMESVKPQPKLEAISPPKYSVRRRQLAFASTAALVALALASLAPSRSDILAESAQASELAVKETIDPQLAEVQVYKDSEGNSFWLLPNLGYDRGYADDATIRIRLGDLQTVAGIMAQSNGQTPEGLLPGQTLPSTDVFATSQLDVLKALRDTPDQTEFQRKVERYLPYARKS